MVKSKAKECTNEKKQKTHSKKGTRRHQKKNSDTKNELNEEGENLDTLKGCAGRLGALRHKKNAVAWFAYVLWTAAALSFSSTIVKGEECLTGGFVDIQNWVLEDGSLTPELNDSITLDLSGQPHAIAELRQLMINKIFRQDADVSEEPLEEGVPVRDDLIQGMLQVLKPIGQTVLQTVGERMGRNDDIDKDGGREEEIDENRHKIDGVEIITHQDDKIDGIANKGGKSHYTNEKRNGNGRKNKTTDADNKKARINVVNDNIGESKIKSVSLEHEPYVKRFYRGSKNVSKKRRKKRALKIMKVNREGIGQEDISQHEIETIDGRENKGKGMKESDQNDVEGKTHKVSDDQTKMGRKGHNGDNGRNKYENIKTADELDEIEHEKQKNTLSNLEELHRLDNVGNEKWIEWDWDDLMDVDDDADDADEEGHVKVGPLELSPIGHREDEEGNFVDHVYPEVQKTQYLNETNLEDILYLSLARNELQRIPLFYSEKNGTSVGRWRHLRYLSLYGNKFSAEGAHAGPAHEPYLMALNASAWEELTAIQIFSFAADRSNWAEDLAKLEFPNLLELDLRNCSIEVLDDETFISMPILRRLYLSHNLIYQISAMAFEGLSTVVHLDLSMNTLPYRNGTIAVIEGMTIASGAFSPLQNLKSLDFSYTRIVQTCASVFGQLSSQMERLSICYTKFPSINKGMFHKTSIKYLDISGNVALEDLSANAFTGIEGTLEVLYAKRNGIKSIDFLENLTKLKILALVDNDINSLEGGSMENLQKLLILDLTNNRITNWNTPVFQHMPNLQLLRLRKNSINLLSHQMLQDFNNIRYFSMALNGFVCNCYLRGFIDGVKRNEMNLEIFPDWFEGDNMSTSKTYELPSNGITETLSIQDVFYHNAYKYYSALIKKRNKYDIIHLEKENSLLRSGKDGGDVIQELPEIATVMNFSFLLLDYSGDEYRCTDYKSNALKYFQNVSECGAAIVEESRHPKPLTRNMVMVIIATVLTILVLVVSATIWKWWYIRYFFMMIKNAAILSIMGKQSLENEGEKVFNYDVFVSYCEEDRAWVLDELLTEVEGHGAVSVCLHERDFQVGLSILENIISCMDRSRTLLMVVSHQFLLSKWCQFEMHLAQHRLLETRREQLILVLLEDIPRRRRPNTLHYLMMTKTYIVWPRSKDERPAFWRRLRKALQQDSNSGSNVSVA